MIEQGHYISPPSLTPSLALSEHAFYLWGDDFKSHCCSLCSRSGLVTGCNLGVDVTKRVGGKDGAGEGVWRDGSWKVSAPRVLVEEREKES